MDEKLLIHFLTRQCTADELRDVDRWMKADVANANWLFDMEHVWSLKDELRFSDEREIGKAYQRFQASLYRKKKSTPVRLSILSFAKYAAVILLIGLLAANLYRLNIFHKDPAVFNIINVPNGQRVDVVLSDGTKIWLDSGSTLRYPSKFSDRERNVTLQGGAFFEVAHDAKTPFVLHSDLMEVKVLGTTFDVKAYPGENMEVTLAKGRVEVLTNDNKYHVTLKPNEQVLYSKKEGLKLVKNIDTNKIKSWTTGELYFMDRPLSEITKTLERYFDVTIQIQDSTVAADVFTCHFRETDSLERILALLSETKRIDYRIVNDQQIEIVKHKNRFSR